MMKSSYRKARGPSTNQHTFDMAKRSLSPEMSKLESDIIDTLIAGHHEWRPDLGYPESRSDMQAAVRGLLRMYDVKRLPLARELTYSND